MGMVLIGKLSIPDIPDFPEEPETPVDNQALADHIADPTPHPAYDNLASGRFKTMLRNGMA
jgi:hypothetical protein